MSRSYKSPLEGYEGADPLPDTLNEDGKSLYNPPGPRSVLYDSFPEPFKKNKNGFDFHIYFMHTYDDERKYAYELHERVRREFPELRTYKVIDRPIGPHSTGTFEVNTFTPHQTGALFSWLVINRGPCSVLIHPNTNDGFRDHVENMAWIGRPWPLRTDVLRPRTTAKTDGPA
ncbi:DOPA-like domain-containing protein [Gloeopeniophorella convolvens]|nr:DOPA-like domain-containing protein [Gloeopeniophorella convolvens]